MGSQDTSRPAAPEPPQGPPAPGAARPDVAHALLDSLADGYFELDLGGHLTDCNRALAELSGYPPQELLGQSYRRFSAADTAERLIPTFNHVYRTGQAMRKVAVELTHRDGTRHAVEISISLVRDAAGQPSGFRGVLREMSDRPPAETQFRELLETAPDAMVIVDPRGEMVLVNSQTEKLFGYAREALLGKTVEMLLPERYRHQHVAQRARYFTHPHARPMGAALELYGLHQAGHEFPIEIRLSPLNTQAGTLVTSSIRDIGERTRVAEVLRQSEERFASAFEYAAIGMALVAPDGRWLKVNRALCTLVGYPADELLAKTFQDITHPEDLDADLEQVRRMLAGEIQTYQMEKRYFHRSGSIVWVLLSVSLVRDRTGQPLYFISQIQDITERRRSEAAIHRRNAELAALTQLGQALSRLAAPAELLELIYTVIGTVLNNQNLYIALYDEVSQSISFPVYTIEGQRINRPARPLANGLTEYVIHSGAPLLLPREVTRAARARGIEPQGRESRCYVGVPLHVGDKVLGVLGIQDYEREGVYDAGHVDLLSTIAAQAAIALENARLFAETERLARTDALTGIANRRTLFEVGQRELSRARRFAHPLSALMLDIDHFKQVNDAYGHAVGDQVLQALARGCRDAIRDTDLVARYGGEEFVILLVETGLESARRSAERLREVVAQRATDTTHGPIRVTVSLGVATVQSERDTFETLLGRADQALYAAKQAGRNQVAVPSVGPL